MVGRLIGRFFSDKYDNLQTLEYVSLLKLIYSSVCYFNIFIDKMLSVCLLASNFSRHTIMLYFSIFIGINLQVIQKDYYW